MEKITVLRAIKYKGYELKIKANMYNPSDKTVSVSNSEHYITTAENLLQAFQLVDYLAKEGVMLETEVWEV